VISRHLNERASFVYDISIEEIVSEKIGNHPFKEAAEHFNRDPVVVSKGIKGLEKKIREDETTYFYVRLTRIPPSGLVKFNI